MKIKKLIEELEKIAPLSLQESYDNAGLITGNYDTDVSKALITLDVTEGVVEEAIHHQCQLIISHHPVIFHGLKRLTGSTHIERIIIMALKHNIALYAMHTNLDNVMGGVNTKIFEMLDIEPRSVLRPLTGHLKKLVVFCPVDHASNVRKAMFEAGAGHIGNYDSCSFNTMGEGSFRGSTSTQPYVGQIGKLHFEKEVRIETIFPKHLQNNILQSMFSVHPYEEVAYDIYPLENPNPRIGSGLIGDLKKPLADIEFLKKIKKIMGTGCIKHTPLPGKEIKKIAVCGGSGSFLIRDAIKSGADLFMTSDIKYHDFFQAEDKIILTDIGHYESEQHTKDLIYSILKQKFSNFALLKSKVNTNPLSYL